MLKKINSLLPITCFSQIMHQSTTVNLKSSKKIRWRLPQNWKIIHLWNPNCLLLTCDNYSHKFTCVRTHTNTHTHMVPNVWPGQTAVRGRSFYGEGEERGPDGNLHYYYRNKSLHWAAVGRSSFRVSIERDGMAGTFYRNGRFGPGSGPGPVPRRAVWSVRWNAFQSELFFSLCALPPPSLDSLSYSRIVMTVRKLGLELARGLEKSAGSQRYRRYHYLDKNQCKDVCKTRAAWDTMTLLKCTR